MDFKVKRYDRDFRLYQNGHFLNESEAHTLIENTILSSDWFPTYQRNISRDTDASMWDTIVSLNCEGLVFEHGDEYRLTFDNAQVIPLSDRQRESRDRMRRKADAIPQTDEESYLIHANQCGYLVKNTRLYFVRTKNQWGGSVKTRIKAELEELQSFIDASGRMTLADLDTHIKNKADRTQEFGEYIDGQHMGFAIAIVEFLGLELVIDIESIINQFGQTVDDSGFQSIERWGGSAEIVLDRLIRNRPDLDAENIKAHFVAGCRQELV